ncbi:hypothetical protein ACIBKY_16435 [Nonomuraea sp. NPDC050394]|uniref:hypothetical protein n=1 Tax=Nonomuraea sp. NPDC050394 TaxID=3364363 RepID=UPI00379130D7
MTPLEERLKAALDARAQTYEAGQNAWLSVRARTPMPPRRGRWLLAAIPVAVIALFVPVLLNGGLGRNSAADPGTLQRQLMTGLTPVGEPVELGGLKLWFAKGRLGNPQFCALSGGGREPVGSCAAVHLMGPGTYEGSVAGKEATTVLDYGLASPESAQVRAVTGDGRQIAGTVHRVPGAPGVIWSVSFAAAEQVTKVEFLDAAQRVLGEMPRSMLAGRSRKAKPAGLPYEMAGGLSLRPYQVPNDTQPGATDLEVIWTRAGKEVGSISLKDAYLWKGGGADRPWPVHLQAEDGVVFGAARPDVARVVWTRQGRELTLTPRPDPWGLNLGLFALTADARDEDRGHTLVAYDARGTEIWRDDAPPAREEPGPVREPISDKVVVPGTEDFSFGPVELWFAKDSEGTMLCASGGVRPDGGKSGGCSTYRLDRRLSSRDTLTTYLPEPGAELAYGVLSPATEAVTAVTIDGTRIPAQILKVKGGPAAVWAVRYPANVKIAAFSHREKGRELERVDTWDHSCWQTPTPEGTGQALPGGVTAHLQAPMCLHFWKDGKTLPGFFERLPGTNLRTVIGRERPVQWGQHKSIWYGFALPGTARVEGASKSGRVAAETVPDPWGHGVAMFAAPVPDGVAKKGLHWPDLSFTGYDAAGKVLWTWDRAGLS